MAKAQNPEKTRSQILQSAFEAFYECGFQATGLNDVVERAGVSKGALYNHFSSKAELGLAVVDEIIAPFIRDNWMKNYHGDENPIDLTIKALREINKWLGSQERYYGCPLNNLIQEMSPLDDRFRERLNAVLEEWAGSIADSFRRGQDRGEVDTNVKPDEISWFIITVFEGAIGLVKNTLEPSLFDSATRQLERFLESVRIEHPSPQRA